MRKMLFLLVCLLGLAAFGSARAADAAAFTVTPQEIHPGRTERISFFAPAEGLAELEVKNARGETAAVVRTEMEAWPGINNLVWNGCGDDGYPLLPGEYTLWLTLNGESDSRPLRIEEECPQILSLSADEVLEDGQDWGISVTCTMPASLVVRLMSQDSWGWVLLDEPVEPGDNEFTWNGTVEGRRLPHGRYDLQVILIDLQGVPNDPILLSLISLDRVTPAPLPSPTPRPTPGIVIPSAVSAKEENEGYWTLPVGLLNEEAIWEVMTEPITVIGGDQTKVYRLRRDPDPSTAKSNVVGEITYESQGVHVLETRDDGWTLVEAYNSSYGPKNNSRPGYGVTDALIRGYVKTSLLKTVTPRTDYGLLVDKLTQTMYIFQEGKCIGKLLVSTGLNNSEQSWNETPAGEFLMISRMGGFPAGNLYCPYGLRINGGCAIHEVPYKGDADTPESERDYSFTKTRLGRKASHGCIRVQKDRNDQGQNMKWLWDHIKVNTKVLIWDDTGRRLDYPDDEMIIYYNPDGGRYFHEDPNCSSVSRRFLPLTAITYGELNERFPKMSPCEHCSRLMSKREIDQINLENNP
ncbi:MAG: L,D-transpeptidase family protein [Clostridia bacterium]|nr:L,D-transpeptidase family protein [Clostridia bacterium]